jgi:hypothetical protein
VKILSIETCTEDLINGYLDDGESYRDFSLRPGNVVKYGPAIPKRDFRDLEHFAGVIGKFDPYALVLEEPIEVEGLEFERVRAIVLSDPRFRKPGEPAGEEYRLGREGG